MTLRILLLAGLSASLLAAQAVQTPDDPAPGIARALAAARAATIERVAYRLRFELDPSAEVVHGVVSIRFNLREAAEPLVLDFAGDDLRLLAPESIRESAIREQNGHLIVAPDALRVGENELTFGFTSKVAATGTPLTRYHDSADGRSYFYTLVVPADAHRLFPCFDQPDLKATFDLTLAVPEDFLAIGNGALISSRVEGGSAEHVFATTQPISTYLFAFAAGPFATVVDAAAAGVGSDATRPLRLFVRPSELDKLEADSLFSMHRQSLRWLGEYFDFAYPFDKLDFVLLPGFPYGGMEHAGAIFYRETALLFDHPPTESEQIRRSTLIYHEVSHQWFGNLVTMKWFDDLWLKEGFATFMGYTLLDVLEPGKNAWLRFHQRVKPRAYEVDGTRGTTPIWQRLGNLADAKSAYGAIVYNKAPAVLRELHARLGAETFRRGVQAFLKRHRYANAEWQDLAEALADASGDADTLWSDRWILGLGMPRVAATFTTESGEITSFAVTQRGAQRETQGELWPLSLEVLLLDDSGAALRRARIETKSATTTIGSLVGTSSPACVLVNPGDVAYGLFVLDAVSRNWLLANAPRIDDLLLRATAMSALWNTLREGDAEPAAFADLCVRLIARESDPETQSWLLDSLATTLGRYLEPAAAKPFRERVARDLLERLENGAPDLALQSLRFVARHAFTDAVEALTRGLLDGTRTIPGLELGRRDRFALAAALLANGDAAPLAAERARAGDADVGKELYLAHAAAADASVKQHYFETYLQLDDPPEQWMQDSLGYFHWPGQSALTLPYLLPALERVDWVKRHRKIFFMPAWLDAFINAHSSKQALDIVNGFLADTRLDPDVHRKVLQSLDELERAVAIRNR